MPTRNLVTQTSEDRCRGLGAELLVDDRLGEGGEGARRPLEREAKWPDSRHHPTEAGVTGPQVPESGVPVEAESAGWVRSGLAVPGRTFDGEEPKLGHRAPAGGKPPTFPPPRPPGGREPRWRTGSDRALGRRPGAPGEPSRARRRHRRASSRRECFGRPRRPGGGTAARPPCQGQPQTDQSPDRTAAARWRRPSPAPLVEASSHRSWVPMGHPCPQLRHRPLGKLHADESATPPGNTRPPDGRVEQCKALVAARFGRACRHDLLRPVRP